MIDLVVDLGIIDREQSRRRLRFGESASYFWSPESPKSPRLISRGSRGDVSASEIGPLICKLLNLTLSSCVGKGAPKINSALPDLILRVQFTLLVIVSPEFR